MINLHNYDLIIINSSAGKDSLCSIWDMCEKAKQQQYPLYKICISHQDLGESEWEGTRELATEQARFFGLKIYFSKRRDNNQKEETLLEYVIRRGKWPSSKQRWCTSDFKRGPGARVVTALTKDTGKCNVLYVFGFRAQESPARKKKQVFTVNKKLTTRNRTVTEFYNIHHWDLQQVWATIKTNKLPYHWAYDLGMPRLSCVFCIYSPFDALVIAGRNNMELLNKYIAAEETTGHKFRVDLSLKEVKTAIDSGYTPAKINDWVM